MCGLKIRALGVGASEIQTDRIRLLVDAFHSLLPATEVRDGDIIIFTHDDADHFMPDKVPDLKGADVVFVGPPTIVKPLLELGKANLDQIKVLYTQDNGRPSYYTTKNVKISCFNTPHFNQWDPVHNSYLLEFSGKKVYITGDSLITKELASTIGDVDALICNLVDEGFLTGSEDPRFAIHHNLSYLLKILTILKPEKLIGVHLLDFDGTVDAGDMRKLVEDYSFDRIIIPCNSEEVILIP